METTNKFTELITNNKINEKNFNLLCLNFFLYAYKLLEEF